MGESEDSCRVCASLLYHTFCHNCDRDVDDKGNRIKRLVLGALLADYYFLVLCSTVICRNGGRERQMVLMPFWKYPDIWNKVDYPADLC